MLTAWARFVTGRGRWPVLSVVVVLTALAAVASGDARLDAASASMNARTADQRETASRLAAAFGDDETIVLAVRDARLLEADGIDRLRVLVRKVEKLDGVRGVRSVLDASEIVSGRFGAEPRPVVPEDGSATREDILRALSRTRDLFGPLVGPEGDTAAVFVAVDDQADVVPALRESAREAAGAAAEVHVTGVAVLKHETSAYLLRDQRVILPASVFVFALLLATITRRVSGVVLPLATTAVTLVWTVGLMTTAGYSLNVITSLLPPVVMVISVATAVHLYQEWISLSRTRERGRALAIAVVDRVGVPCALTALTTACGLASLLASEIPAVRELGGFAALGVSVSALVNLTLLPLALARLTPEKRRRAGPSRLTGVLDLTAAAAVRRPGRVLAAFAGITVIAAGGIAEVRNDTDLVSFLPEDAEVVRDVRWVDRELVGTGSLDLLIEARDGGRIDGPDDLDRLRRLGARIREIEGVTAVLGVVPFVERVHAAEHDLTAPALPRDAEEVDHALGLLSESAAAGDLARLVTDDRKKARLAVRIRQVGTAAGERIVARIEEAVVATSGSRLMVTPVGSFQAMITDSNRLVSSQMRGLGLALLAVLICLGTYLRSLSLTIAACGPNVIPIVWCLGAMGYFGIALSTATTMVASVAMGIAVDDTIHYLAGFRRHHRGDVAVAVRETTHRTGRVLVISSCVLAAGFWVGGLGSFRPTVWFSLLTGGTILSALVCDLVLLPACLVLVRPSARRMTG